jgi:hypothetical protein
MSKILLGLLALMAATLVVATPAGAENLGGVQQSIQQTVKGAVDSFSVDKLTSKPSRDLLTLVIGGAVGFIAGGLVNGLGILRIDAFGVALIPIATGLVGIYLANEGYFDQLRGMVDAKP